MNDGGKTYSINIKYNAVLKDRHTDKLTGEFHDKPHKGNVKALSSFFNSVR